MDAELLKYAWNNYPKCKESVSWYNYFCLQTGNSEKYDQFSPVFKTIWEAKDLKIKFEK